MDLSGEELSFFGKRTKSTTNPASSGAGIVSSSRSRGRTAEDVPTSFVQKKCIGWFKEYSTPSSPETIGIIKSFYQLFKVFNNDL
jgi:hypothetical protein